MISTPEMRSQARALQSALDRAEGNRNEALLIIANSEAKVDFATIYVARRFGVALLAQVVAAPANIGRAIR